MKIAIFSDNFYPELSGISDSLVALSRELGKRGHAVRVYAPAYPKSAYWASALPFAEIELGPRVSVRRLFSLPYSSGSGQTRLVIPALAALSDVRKFKPDLIHTHHFFGVGIEALLASKLLRIPLLGTNHTVISEFARRTPVRIPGLPEASVRYSVFYYNRCRLVAAPSRSLLEEMRRSGLRREAVFSSNPIDTKLFHPVSPEEKKWMKERFHLSGLAVLYAGRLSPEKSLEVLVKAFRAVSSKLPEAALVIAGHGSEKHSLQKIAESLGISDKVIFQGTLDAPSLATLYQASDVFAIPSNAENQPISLMQAMASGLPAVGVRARGLIEYISEETGFLVEPGDSEALGHRLLVLLKDASLRERLGEGGRKEAEKHSVETVVSDCEALYEKVLK